MKARPLTSDGCIIVETLEEILDDVEAERSQRLAQRKTRTVVRKAKPSEFDSDSLFEGEK